MSGDKRFGDAVPGGSGFGSSRPPTPGVPAASTAWDVAQPAGSPSPPAPPGARPGPPLGAGSGSGSVDVSDGPVGSPVLWLALAAALDLVAIVLGVVSDARPVLSTLGWVLAGFGAIGSLACFTVEDTRRSTDPWYSRLDWPGRVRTGLVIVAVLAVAADSYRFADWAARR